MQLTPLPPCQFEVSSRSDIFRTKEAPPQNKSFHVALDILSSIILPIGIARIINKVIYRITSFMILPAATIYNLQFDPLNRIKSLNYQRDKYIYFNSFVHQRTIKTADGAELDTLLIQRTIDKPTSEQKWLIFLCGNGSCYEAHLEILDKISFDTNVNVLTGNYRGVMRSRGAATSAHHLVLDAEAMVQFLIYKGIDPANILIHGWSLGGGVAAAVAFHHQEKSHEMKLCSDRSFARISDVVKSLYPGVGWLFAKLPSVKAWEFNSIDHFAKVKGYKFIIYAKRDTVIKAVASLYKNAKKMIENINAIKVKTSVSDEKLHSLNPLDDSIYPHYIQHLKQALKIQTA